MKKLIVFPILFFVIFSLGCIQREATEETTKSIETQVLINGQNGSVTVYQDSTPVVLVKVQNNLPCDLLEPKIYWSGCGNLKATSQPVVIKAHSSGMLSYELNLSDINIPEGASMRCYIEGRLCFNRSDPAYTEVNIYLNSPVASLNQNYESSFLEITFSDQYVKSNKTTTMMLTIRNVGDGYVYYPETFEPHVLRSITFVPGNKLEILEVAGKSVNEDNGKVIVSVPKDKSLLRLIDGEYLELPIRIKADTVNDTLTTMNVVVNYTYCIHLPKVSLTIKS